MLDLFWINYHQGAFYKAPSFHYNSILIRQKSNISFFLSFFLFYLRTPFILYANVLSSCFISFNLGFEGWFLFTNKTVTFSEFGQSGGPAVRQLDSPVEIAKIKLTAFFFYFCIFSPNISIYMTITYNYCHYILLGR
jgi:hypothetical protein